MLLFVRIMSAEVVLRHESTQTVKSLLVENSLLG